jgi:hypothetical protein
MSPKKPTLAPANEETLAQHPAGGPQSGSGQRVSDQVAAEPSPRQVEAKIATPLGGPATSKAHVPSGTATGWPAKSPTQQPSVAVGGRLVLVVVDVVVVGAAQPAPAHESQQLAKTPPHADPPPGARHAAALRFTLHRLAPLALVWQQVTVPGGLPQVDRDRHRLAVPTQSAGRTPATASERSSSRAQRMNVP